MPNQYFTINDTFRNILGWIDRYGKLFPPPAGKHLRYVKVGPTPIWPGNAVHWSATAYAHARWQPQVPILEIGADEENGRCRVWLTCLDPNSESWYRAMVDFLAPDDAAGDAARDVYPLPELPSPGVTKEPPPAAPAPSSVPARVERKAPSVPKRDGHLRRWKAIWKNIKPLVAEGASNDEIEAWFPGHDSHLRPSKDQLIDIIRAGEAGLLD